MADHTQYQFTFPIYFDLSATFLYALTGALVAVRRQYDIIGLFVLALVCGVGGGLMRDSIFIQNGPPLAIRDDRYLYAVLAGCLVALLFGHRMDRLQKIVLFADALGLGAYAVVGVTRSLNANFGILAAIMIGVINASGGGLLRDVLVREEPLLFKPGQVYVLAALVGAGLFVLLLKEFHETVETAGLLAVGATFLVRLLAIIFNWKTVAVVRIPPPAPPAPPPGPPPPPA
jgi:uncharacterized membrane protein YeiH